VKVIVFIVISYLPCRAVLNPIMWFLNQDLEARILLIRLFFFLTGRKSQSKEHSNLEIQCKDQTWKCCQTLHFLGWSISSQYLFLANTRSSGIASGQLCMCLLQCFDCHITSTVVYYPINTVISELCSVTKRIPLPGDVNHSVNKHDKSNSDEQKRGKKRLH